MQVRIYVDNTNLGLPAFIKSRTIWLMFLLAGLNLYDQFGDITLLLSAYGVIPDPRLMQWINTAGFFIGAYFRATAKQPLGKAGRRGSLSAEEIGRASCRERV